MRRPSKGTISIQVTSKRKGSGQSSSPGYQVGTSSWGINGPCGKRITHNKGVGTVRGVDTSVIEEEEKAVYFALGSDEVRVRRQKTRQQKGLSIQKETPRVNEIYEEKKGDKKDFPGEKREWTSSQQESSGIHLNSEKKKRFIFKRMGPRRAP